MRDVFKLPTSLGGLRKEYKYYCFCLLLACYLFIVDHGLALNISDDTRLRWAVIDNMSHGVVGLSVWKMRQSRLPAKDDALTKKWKQIVRCWLPSVCCGVCACALDVDHFLAAGSLRVEDATSLSERPILHSTVVVFAIAMVISAVTYCLRVKYPDAASKFHRDVLPDDPGFIFLVAGVSHHLRDASRRGFWLWPFPLSTPPVPYSLYMFGTLALPIGLSYIHVGATVPTRTVHAKVLPV